MDIFSEEPTDLLICFKQGDTERFSFPQKIWLEPGVDMGWHQGRLSLYTLAINILDCVVSEPRTQALPRGYTSPKALILAVSFAEEVLATMPPEGGKIPKQLVNEWMGSQDTVRELVTLHFCNKKTRYAEKISA